MERGRKGPYYPAEVWAAVPGGRATEGRGFEIELNWGGRWRALSSPAHSQASRVQEAVGKSGVCGKLENPGLV